MTTLTAGDAAAGGAARADGATSAKLELRLPEGQEIDKAVLAKFEPVAAELGLDSPKAQKLVDLAVEMQTGWAKRATDAWSQTKDAWATAAKQDKEYGGEHFAQNIQIAQRAIAKFGTPELKQLLDQYGLGNHPEMVRLAYRVGRALSEDSVNGAQGGAPVRTPANDQEAFLRKQYPSMFKE